MVVFASTFSSDGVFFYSSAAGKATYQTAPLRDKEIARDNPSHRGCRLCSSQIPLFIFYALNSLRPFSGAPAQKCGAVNEKLRVEDRQLLLPNVATSVPPHARLPEYN